VIELLMRLEVVRPPNEGEDQKRKNVLPPSVAADPDRMARF
jgi:hypothetical protein